MEELLYDFPDYSIATEGISVSTIKENVARLIRTICNAMQQLSAWISSKFCKFFNIDMITVNQDYYNEIMNTITIVSNIDLPMISKIDASIKVLRNNVNEVKEIYGDLQKKVDDLRLISENVEKIIPSKYGKTIRIGTSKLKHLKLTFLKMKKDADSQIYKLKALKNDPDSVELLKYTQAQLTMIGHMAAINCMKSNICIRLLDKLWANAIHNTNEEKKETVDEEGNDVNAPGLESFITFCDDMMITEEGFSEYKKIYKKCTKDIATLDKEFNAIPEDTLADIEQKTEVLGEILLQIRDAKKYMSQVTPNTFDKFINSLSVVANGTIGAVAIAKVKNDISRVDVGSPEIYNTLKNIAFLVMSVASISLITSKGSFAGRRAKYGALYDKLSRAYDDYSDKMHKLSKKKRDMEKEIEKELGLSK